MYRPVMPATERDRELIADLAAERTGLRKSEVMGVRGLAATQQTGLLHHKAKVVPVAIAARRRHHEHALINPDWISAAFIYSANVMSTGAATFGWMDVHNLSALGRRELG